MLQHHKIVIDCKVYIFPVAHRISQKERIKAVITATEDHFNYLASMESKEAQNDSVTSQLIRTNELSQAQLEVVASFIAGGEVLTLKVCYLTS